MVSIYEDIRNLYDLLASEHGNIAKVKGRLEHLKKDHGVNKEFIKEVFKTMALEKMISFLMEREE